MKRFLAIAGVVAAVASIAAAPRNEGCADIVRAGVSDVRVVSAREVAPGTAWAESEAPGLKRVAPPKVGFCRVEGVIEKEIGFELWLPLKGDWNGKMLGAGVGGDAGAYNYQDVARGLHRGYAAATTDTGHKSSDVNWMLGDPQRLTNYELRANHLLAEKSKALIKAFYGSAPRRSYFIGCSGGGRQGLKEMQRFPGDYDGVIAGAYGPKTPEMTARRMWELLLRDNNPGLMTPADWALIQKAGVAQCDGLDGVTDGVAEDPRRCTLDLQALRCQGEKTAQCLSAAQVDFARQFYDPLRDEDGRAIDEGLLPGVLVDGVGRSQLALGTFGRAIRRQDNWNGEGFNLKSDLAAIDRVMPELRADETDVAAFRKRGGKLIGYHGWVDPAVAARMVIAYHEALDAKADDKGEQFSRLYMLPGVYHCAGGPGADQIGGAGRDAPIVDARHDLLSALEDWVEKGRAPGAMIASKVENGAVTRTHLICPYPQAASYRGGNPGDAASYECRQPERAP